MTGFGFATLCMQDFMRGCWLCTGGRALHSGAHGCEEWTPEGCHPLHCQGQPHWLWCANLPPLATLEIMQPCTPPPSRHAHTHQGKASSVNRGCMCRGQSERGGGQPIAGGFLLGRQPAALQGSPSSTRFTPVQNITCPVYHEFIGSISMGSLKDNICRRHTVGL
jgi:hypothetical protein